MIDLTGGIIHHHDAVLGTFQPWYPGVGARIGMEEHASEWPSRPGLSVWPPAGSLGYQSGCLQGGFDPGVGKPDTVCACELLMKVEHVKVVVVLSIQG
jgi:hypothetical protein